LVWWRSSWLDEVPSSGPFTSVLRVKLASAQDAARLKLRLSRKPFLGQMLQLSYAPGDESTEETIQKLNERRRRVLSAIALGHHESHEVVRLGLEQKPQNSVVQRRLQRWTGIPCTAQKQLRKGFQCKARFQPESLVPVFGPRDREKNHEPDTASLKMHCSRLMPRQVVLHNLAKAKKRKRQLRRSS